MKAEQFAKFKAEVKPGDIVFISGRGWINDLIVRGQSTTDKTWTNQLGHVGFIGADSDKKGNFMIHESAIDKVGTKMASGILIRPVDEWNDYKDVRWLVIMRIKGITAEQIRTMTDTSIRLKAKGIKYPIKELAGTLLSSLYYNFLGSLKWINKKYFEARQDHYMMKKNIFDGSGFYCIAFANHCAESAGLRIIPKTVDESRCKVGDGLRNELAYVLKFIVPGQYKDYEKAAGQPFDLDITE